MVSSPLTRTLFPRHGVRTNFRSAIEAVSLSVACLNNPHSSYTIHDTKDPVDRKCNRNTYPWAWHELHASRLCRPTDGRAYDTRRNNLGAILRDKPAGYRHTQSPGLHELMVTGSPCHPTEQCHLPLSRAHRNGDCLRSRDSHIIGDDRSTNRTSCVYRVVQLVHIQEVPTVGGDHCCRSVRHGALSICTERERDVGATHPMNFRLDIAGSSVLRGRRDDHGHCARIETAFG